ncbi:MAG: HD domain-containing protein, partial [Aureliella sp.]
GVDHVLRVLRTAREIQAQVGGDAFIVALAAWLHDVGDAKFHQGVERSAQFTREVLASLEVSSSMVDHVAHIVDNISFRKGAQAAKLSLEGQIVQDADRLDALGAIGIVRTIQYGAAFGQPFFIHDNCENLPTGVAHFYDKLFKLRELLNTEPARQIAEQRETFMRDFLRQFFAECGESTSEMH